MEIIEKRTYKSNELKPQKWHNTLKSVQTLFQNRGHLDITSEYGMNGLLSQESSVEAYASAVSALIPVNGMDHTAHDNVKQVCINSIKDARKGVFSTEGADAMANNASYSALAPLNAWTVIGYTARSKCLDMFQTFTSDKPTVTYSYNINYVKYGNDPKEYYSPQAERNGDLAHLYVLPQLLPADGKVGQKGFEHLELMDDEQSTNGGSKVWIKIQGGVFGNLFADNGEFDPTKFTLEKNPKITGIAYEIEAPDGSKKKGTQVVFFERHTAFGEVQKKHFYNDFSIAYDYENPDTGETVTAYARAAVNGDIDLDSGDYKFSGVGPVTHIQLDVRTTNVANELGTIRAGVRNVIEDFDVDSHPYGSVPIVPEVSDDFNAGGEGVSAVSYLVDRVSKGLAAARDQLMENELDMAYRRPIQDYDLWPKVGGWKGLITFPLDARLPGGGDPYSYMKMGLKTTILNHLSRAEMDTMFEDDTPREWIGLGSEQDIQLIPDVTFSQYTGEGGVGGGATEKYGFSVNNNAGFIDNLGRRVKLIASHYRRHYIDSRNNRVPMRLILKSYSMEQPTTLYMPYSFRVYSGISPEFPKRTGLIISARDCIRVMSNIQTRVNLLGNTDNLFFDICEHNNPRYTGPRYTTPSVIATPLNDGAFNGGRAGSGENGNTPTNIHTNIKETNPYEHLYNRQIAAQMAAQQGGKPSGNTDKPVEDDVPSVDPHNDTPDADQP